MPNGPTRHFLTPASLSVFTVAAAGVSPVPASAVHLQAGFYFLLFSLPPPRFPFPYCLGTVQISALCLGRVLHSESLCHWENLLFPCSALQSEDLCIRQCPEIVKEMKMLLLGGSAAFPGPCTFSGLSEPWSHPVTGTSTAFLPQFAERSIVGGSLDSKSIIHLPHDMFV